MADPTPTAAGWYQSSDPRGYWRWWDGVVWTEHFRGRSVTGLSDHLRDETPDETSDVSAEYRQRLAALELLRTTAAPGGLTPSVASGTPTGGAPTPRTPRQTGRGLLIALAISGLIWFVADYNSSDSKADRTRTEQQDAAHDAAKDAEKQFNHTCLITATAQKLCGSEAAAWCNLTQPLRDTGTGASVETSNEACDTVTP